MPWRASLFGLIPVLLLSQAGCVGLVRTALDREGRVHTDAPLLEALLSGDRCCRDGCCSACDAAPAHAPEPPQAVMVLAPPEPAQTYVTKQGTVWTRMAITGGYLEVTGKPARSTERVLLSVRTPGRLAAPCTVWLERDGQPVEVTEVARATDHEARLVVGIDVLAGLERSVVLHGDVCGQPVELDDVARQALGRFEARFRAASHAPRSASAPVAEMGTALQSQTR